jgi:hypothetical protein
MTEKLMCVWYGAEKQRAFHTVKELITVTLKWVMALPCDLCHTF